MPSICKIGDYSTGADGYPPSALISTPITKTYINGQLIGAVGAIYAPHTQGKTTHSDVQRTIIQGSSKTFIEGFAVARTGDLIADGDTVGDGNETGFAE